MHFVFAISTSDWASMFLQKLLHYYRHTHRVGMGVVIFGSQLLSHFCSQIYLIHAWYLIYIL